MKKSQMYFISLLLSAVSLNTLAYTTGDRITHDGIIYEVTNGTSNPVKVQLADASGATGTEVVIPSTFSLDNDDNDFLVWAIGEGGKPNWPSSVTKITLPETVTQLNYAAFGGSNITELKLPKSVSVIGSNAFAYTSKLINISVDGNNEKWKDVNGILYTKDGKTLQYVPRCHPFTDGVFTIPDGVEQMFDQNTLSNNSNVRKLEVPESMKTVQNYVVASNGATYYSISGCTNLTEVVVDSNNPYLYSDEKGVVYKRGTGENKDILHFYPMGKTDESFTVPVNVTALDPVACYSAQFKSLNLSNVTEIGEKALESCNNLEDIIIPAGMTDIPEGAIVGTNLKNIYVNADNQVYTDIDGVLFSKDEETLLQFPAGRKNTADNPYVVPDNTRVIGTNSFKDTKISYITIKENTVTTISDHAFYNNGFLKTIVVPEGVTSVGESAFQTCRGLISVSLPSTLNTLPANCFRGCVKLAEIEISEGLEEIQTLCFSNCAFTTFTLPKSLKSVEGMAFKECKNLETVTIPDGSELTTLGNSVFVGCSALKTVTFGENCKLQSIGSNVFADLESLESINNIPASVTTIGDGAFARTPNLGTITFEEGSQLTKIGEGAFADCGITSIEIPENVTTIEYEAFRNCNVLEEVTLSAKVSNISPEAFKYCTKLKAINVEDGNQVYSSSDGILLSKDKTILRLFPAGKANGEFTLLPPSITSIGDHAFYYCENLKDVTIPNKVTSIGKRSFGFCKNLKAVTFLCDNMINPNNIAQKKGEASFDDGVTNTDNNDYRKDITIYVRKNLYNDYANNTFYQEFKCIETSFIDETTRTGGLNKTRAKEEFIYVGKGTVDLLSVETEDETYVLPTTVKQGNDTYNVSLVGDYLFTANGSQVSNVKEVVVPGNVQYIGARAFLTDAALTSRNSSVESVFLIGDQLNEDLLSTARFGLTPEDLGSSKKYYDEFGTGTKIYVREKAEDTYKTAWTNYAENISYKIPYTQNGTYGTFAREFDVDFSEVNGVNSEKPVTDNPVLIAFTGTGKYVKNGDDYSVLMTSINLGDQEGKDGTYVPAGSGVLMKKYKEPEGEEGLYYQIAETGISDAFVEGNFMKGITLRSEKIEKNNGYNRYYISGGKLHEMTKETTFGNHKAYLEIATSDIPTGAKVMLSFTDVNGETTGIESIVENVADNENLYNLQGQRVNNATKGIYIKNGKKILVK